MLSCSSIIQLVYVLMNRDQPQVEIFQSCSQVHDMNLYVLYHTIMHNDGEVGQRLLKERHPCRHQIRCPTT